MERLYQPPLPGLGTVLNTITNLSGFLSEPVSGHTPGAGRACFDRYLCILDALERRSLIDSSLLDIGCSSGFFAYLFAVTACSQVTAVEDARGALAGYGENAFLAPLRRAKREYALHHLEIIDKPVEQFLIACPDRQWDVVLCLSVLHHFYTGYGDRPERGRLTEEGRQDLFVAIGRATGSVLYLEVDHGRVPDEFFADFMKWGRFRGCDLIASSASEVGETRSLFELWK
jgi:SAM-dependent methyltransferase